MVTTTNAQTGYQSLTVPCDNEQGTFIIERLQGTRISIRIGKTALFMTYAEAVRVAECMTELMGDSKLLVRR
jgi:hypothetical protein